MKKLINRDRFEEKMEKQLSLEKKEIGLQEKNVTLAPTEFLERSDINPIQRGSRG